MTTTFRQVTAVLLASTAMITALSGTAHAQQAQPSAAEASAGEGIVTGRVFDERTGASLRGAIVRVVGTGERDVTTEDGRFQLNVPAGTSTIEVDYLGFGGASQDVSVPTRGRATVNFGLDIVDGQDQIVVRAAVTGQALAINQQRTADGIVNIYSEEVFGPAPDGNIGFALQRLPGLSINTNQAGEPTGVNIRGVEGDFNSFQVNGNRVAAAGSRGLNLGDFSNDGISNIEVIKAATPDRDGDAIGGIVNVITRSAFERSGRRIDLQAGGNYRDLSDNWGHSLSARYSDLFSLGGDYENLGISLSFGSYKSPFGKSRMSVSA